MSEDRFQLLRLLEAILFASADPLSEAQLKQRLPEGVDVLGLIQEIRDHYSNRGVHLMEFEGRYAFRTASDLSSLFHIEREVQRKAAAVDGQRGRRRGRRAGAGADPRARGAAELKRR